MSSTSCQCDLLETTQNEFPFFVKIKHPIVFGKQALIFGKHTQIFRKHLPLFRYHVLHFERAEYEQKEPRQVPVRQVLASYSTNFQLSVVYSSTAAWAAANRHWLSTTYRVFVNYWRLFDDTFCTFLHAHGNENVFLRQKNLFLCHIFNFWFYNKLLDSGLTIVNCKCFMYSIEPKPSETLCKLCLQS